MNDYINDDQFCTHSVGDICIYKYHDEDKNKSISLVEIFRMFEDNPEVAEVKILKVFVDDSGNSFFTYLFKTGKTMNVSLKYLHTILHVNMKEFGK